jgi:hypothetical protein
MLSSIASHLLLRLQGTLLLRRMQGHFYCGMAMDSRWPWLREELGTFVVVLDVIPFSPPNGLIPLKDFLLAFQSKS